MSGKPRQDVVDPMEIALFHCWNRTVRGLFLCGFDALQQQDREYRRGWIHDFEQRLAGLFGIEVAFHATLGNHLHLVLRSRPDVVARWKDNEVVRRWLAITKMKRTGKVNVPEPTAARVAMEMAKPGRIKTLRKRLSHVSWFMGALCENVSRRINFEEGKTGTCWEDRFGCRRLLDEASVLVCGIYVDLNLIRAGMAQRIEESRYTSIYDRLRGRRQQAGTKSNPQEAADGWLCELTLDEHLPVTAVENTSSATARRASDKGLLSVAFESYLELLNCAVRKTQGNELGAVSTETASILRRLQINPELWVEAVHMFQDWFGSFVGKVNQITGAGTGEATRRFRGQGHCAELFG